MGMHTLAFYSTLAYWVAGLGQVAAAIGTGWVVWQTRKMLERNDRAERLEVFMEFSREYDALKDRIGHAALDDEKVADMIKADKLSRADVEAVVDLMRLFERQQFLHAAAMVDAMLWRIWKNGILKHFAKGVFRHVWVHRKKYPAAHFSERFVHWVEANTALHGSGK